MSTPKVLLVGLCVLPFVLTACDDDSGSADEDQISAAIDRAATSGDPAACTDVQTQAFLEQTSGSTGQDAIKSCEEDAAETVADEIEVNDIEVDGDAATAKGAVTGSIFDGQTLVIGLVKEGDQWKLDDFQGFEDFNRDAMVASFKEQLESDAQANPQAVDCIVGNFQSASDEDLQSFFTGEGTNVEDQIFEPCSKFFQS